MKNFILGLILCISALSFAAPPQQKEPTVKVTFAKDLVVNGTYQKLVTSAESNSGPILYTLYDGGHLYEEIPTAINAGTYTVYYSTESTEQYESFYATATVTIGGTSQTIGAVTINEDNEKKKFVTIEGYCAADEDFKISEDFNAEKVVLTRKFDHLDVYATIFLPFEASTNQLEGISEILQFAGVTPNAETNRLQVETISIWDDSPETAPITIQANTPYIIKMKAPSLEIKGPVTFKKTKPPFQHIGNWTFVGTYTFKNWDPFHSYPYAHENEFRGRYYGFAAKEKKKKKSNYIREYQTAVKAGEFVQFGIGARIHPMRAFLVYDPDGSYAAESTNSKALAKSAAYNYSSTPLDFELPYSMDVVVINRKNNTTSDIGKIDPDPNSLKKNRYYDVKGRNLHGKPKARGAYYKSL